MVINTIKNEIKVAMINKDEIKKNTLRQVLNKANAEAKENSLKNKTAVENELTDEVCLSAINKEIKQLDQTIDMLEKGNKTESELYKSSVISKKILMAYLPEQMSEEELYEQISEFLKDKDKSKKGVVMGLVMGNFKGKADNKLINKIVDQILSN